MLNNPPIRETSLDEAVISALIPRAAPTLLPSGAIVKMDIHNLGGMRHFARWEIADIGLLCFVHRNGSLIAQKAAFLQSKRLYPKNNDIIEDDPVDFAYGMNKFLRPSSSLTAAILDRNYVFDRACIYGALKPKSDQLKAIDAYSAKFGSEIFYLLYNPPQLPMKIRHPITEFKALEGEPEIGCRVVGAMHLHSRLAALDEKRSPTLVEATKGHHPKYGNRLEQWAADLLLTCQVGREFSQSDDEALYLMMERRSGPIGAAIALSIILPA
ncbi:MAG: hypothetical protein ACKVP5_21855 [Aestuariivirga sp.]